MRYILKTYKSRQFLHWYTKRCENAVAHVHIGSSLEDLDKAIAFIPNYAPLMPNERLISDEDARLFMLEYLAREALGDT